MLKSSGLIWWVDIIGKFLSLWFMKINFVVFFRVDVKRFFFVVVSEEVMKVWNIGVDVGMKGGEVERVCGVDLVEFTVVW